MSLLLITNPPTTFGSNADWITLLTRSNGNMLGHGLSIPIFTLTNWDGTTTRPQIAEGSIIEVGGSFYQADADTALTDEGGLSDGTVHIKLTPGAGSPDPLTVVPTLTNDALPAWDANKAGWYTGANKYLPFEMNKASAVYTEKGEYKDQNKNILSIIDTTGLNISGKITSDTISSGAITSDTISSGAITATTVNTGQGANELYDMNQNVTTTSTVRFNSINTSNVDLKTKTISGAIGSGVFVVSINHGLTASKIRGVSSSILNRSIDKIKVTSTQITITTDTITSGASTCYIIIGYEE